MRPRHRRRALARLAAALVLLLGAAAAMRWYASPATAVLLADAWLLCVGAR